MLTPAPSMVVDAPSLPPSVSISPSTDTALLSVCVSNRSGSSWSAAPPAAGPVSSQSGRGAVPKLAVRCPARGSLSMVSLRGLALCCSTGGRVSSCSGSGTGTGSGTGSGARADAAPGVMVSRAVGGGAVLSGVSAASHPGSRRVASRSATGVAAFNLRCIPAGQGRRARPFSVPWSTAVAPAAPVRIPVSPCRTPVPARCGCWAGCKCPGAAA